VGFDSRRFHFRYTCPCHFGGGVALAAPTLPPEARRVDRKIRAVFFPVPEIAVYAESTHSNNVYESATYLNICGAFDSADSSACFQHRALPWR